MNQLSTLPPPRSPAPAPLATPPVFDPRWAQAMQAGPGQQPMASPPQGQAQAFGQPGAMPAQNMMYPAQGYPQPINIVVQNTNTMTQGPAAGALVRVADRNKWVAALLAFFLGGFGIHKFYLGQTGMGIVYLLFFWTLIPMVISLIETLLLVLASQREFDVRFNSRLAR
ncbi:TM2 domain-containing protein [Nannocystis bainbridge]|uniref:TM2 domain-containing protein n=1 Tax=Nannocystis bainbridge TaxID=2995303 RepID=A0ABT5DY77_9BACT|nr:TM2 domain-containing protein [Nannocystis bainbridge]MDC0718100.1 TM2 domain-containing protein [Nannocystis bainbridge]